MWRVAAFGIALGVLLISGAQGEEKTLDEQAIVESSVDAFAEAFNQQNVKALAELFTEEAEYVDSSGLVFHGRSVIAAEFAAAFSTREQGTTSVELVSIRPIAKDAIVEEGVSTFQPKGDGPESHTRYVAIHVKQSDDSWLIASVRELEAGEMSHNARLHALSWLLGAWHEDVDGSVVRTEWKWSENGSYLLSKFSVRQSTGESWEGSHRIGWDAERQQFRSWVFEANGGVMEGWWRQNVDGSWSVALSGVDASGIRRAVLFTYEADGPEAIRVSQSQRIVGGFSLPGSVHRIVKQPPTANVSAVDSTTEK